MGKIIIIAGPTAAGKDSAMIQLMKIRPEIKPLVSCTTRPIRPGETDGLEYDFVSEEYFKKLYDGGLILSARTYYTIQKGIDAIWHYGAPYPSTDLDYVTIVDHQGAQNIIKKMGRENIVLFYLSAPDTVLRERCVRRGDELAEFDRRLADDRIQFNGIEKIYDAIVDTEFQIPLDTAMYISGFLDGRNL